jgi:hypothetical protein
MKKLLALVLYNNCFAGQSPIGDVKLFLKKYPHFEMADFSINYPEHGVFLLAGRNCP